MKKTLLIAGIAAWVMVLALIVAVAAAIIWRGGEPENGLWQENGEAALLKEEQLTLPSSARLIIETDSVDIALFAGEGEQLRLRQYGSGRAAKQELFTVTENSNSITVRIRQRLRFNLGWRQQERLEVELPQAWLGDIDAGVSSGQLRLNDAFTWQDVSLACSSGSIVIERELTAANLRLEARSGSIRGLAALTVAGKLNMAGNSGDIRLNKPVFADELYGDINSGNIKLDAASSRQFKLSATSGSVQAAELSGAGSARVNSGSIDIGLLKPLGNVDLQAGSGKIVCTVPQDLAFNFEGRCTSGLIKADFPLLRDERSNRYSGSVGDNPDVNISAWVNSGSAHINRR